MGVRQVRVGVGEGPARAQVRRRTRPAALLGVDRAPENPGSSRPGSSSCSRSSNNNNKSCSCWCWCNAAPNRASRSHTKPARPLDPDSTFLPHPRCGDRHREHPHHHRASARRGSMADDHASRASGGGGGGRGDGSAWCGGVCEGGVCEGGVCEGGVCEGEGRGGERCHYWSWRWSWSWSY